MHKTYNVYELFIDDGKVWLNMQVSNIHINIEYTTHKIFRILFSLCIKYF